MEDLEYRQMINRHEEIMSNIERDWVLSFVKNLPVKIFLDGNKWCVMFGENIQSGVCGFGASPYDAIVEFNKQMHKCVVA